jgi:hypothetical protein
MFEIYDNKKKATVGLGSIIHDQVLEVDESDNFRTKKIIGFDMDYLLHSHINSRKDVHAWAANALLKESVELAQNNGTAAHQIFHTQLGPDVSIEGHRPATAVGFDSHPGMQQVGGLAVRQRSFPVIPFEPAWQNIPNTLHIAH